MLSLIRTKLDCEVSVVEQTQTRSREHTHTHTHTNAQEESPVAEKKEGEDGAIEKALLEMNTNKEAVVKSSAVAMLALLKTLRKQPGKLKSRRHRTDVRNIRPCCVYHTFMSFIHVLST